MLAIALTIALLPHALAFSGPGLPGLNVHSGARLSSSSVRPPAVGTLRMGLFDGLFGGAPEERPSQDISPQGQGVWEEYSDPGSGKKYYCNTATQETMWEDQYKAMNGARGAGTAQKAPAVASPNAQRNDGVWEEYSDPGSGKKFYFNTATQETLWEDQFKEATRPRGTETVEKVEAPVAAAASFGGFGLPSWKQNAAKEAAGMAKGSAVFGGGNALDSTKLNIKWRQGGGTTMQKGGFGYAYFGTYDARPNPAAAARDIAVVCKVPTEDPDAVRAFVSELEINLKIASYGGLPGVAEYLGPVDLEPISAQLPPAIGTKQAGVWKKVKGQTLDRFFDRGGAMSPVIATTLRVQDSQPVKLPGNKLVYLKSNLCRRLLGEVLLCVASLHSKGIIHRDLKPQNIMLVENDVASPFRIIDFGSAVFKGKKPVMDDLSEIYAPPEAPYPDSSNPEAYDIYMIGVIALRVLMPALTAGEAGVQNLGSVTVEELPAYGYDLVAWAQYRATNKVSFTKDFPLNNECKGLLVEKDLLDILASMFQKQPSKRPSAEQILARLGPEWQGRLAEQKAGVSNKGPCGKCGTPVTSMDEGRTRNAKGVYFHAECSGSSATLSR